MRVLGAPTSLRAVLDLGPIFGPAVAPAHGQAAGHAGLAWQGGLVAAKGSVASLHDGPKDTCLGWSRVMHKLEHLDRRGIGLRSKIAKIWRGTVGNKPTEVCMSVNFRNAGRLECVPKKIIEK